MLEELNFERNWKKLKLNIFVFNVNNTLIKGDRSDTVENISLLLGCSAEKDKAVERNSEAQSSIKKRKRCAPAVATSEAWEEFYKEEQEIKKQIQLAKQKRQEERKQKSLEKEEQKKIKAALRVLKQHERDELKEQKKKERDAVRIEKAKERLEKMKNKMKKQAKTIN